MAGFGHGGPRLVLDPIDGTRPLMHDLRAAWVVLGRGSGRGAPALSDLDFGTPDGDPRHARAPRPRAHRGPRTWRPPPRDRPRLRRRGCGPRAPRRRRPAPGPGALPLLRIHAGRPRRRPGALARRVRRALEGVDPLTVLDDQLCSNGGQFALLACGTYRAVVDARVTLNEIHGMDVQTAKPYDLAGGIVVAREAGCVVERPDGAPLDMPIDATRPSSSRPTTTARPARDGAGLARALASPDG